MQPFTMQSKILAPVARLLPPEAMTVFVEAANKALAGDFDYNDAIITGWNAVRFDWERPPIGKRWIRKSEPTSGDVHVDSMMGSMAYDQRQGKKKKPPTAPMMMNKEISDKDLGTGHDPAEGLGGKPSTLYVHRKVLNGDDIHQWAKAQGFEHALPKDELHVTLAFSKTPFDTSKLQPQKNVIEVPPDDADRSVEALGDKGAVALRFQHPHLEQRHQEIRNAGASHDFPTYKPHMTVTWNSGNLDPKTVTPYTGAIHLGPEVFAPIDDEWFDNIHEDTMSTKLLKIVKADDEQRIAYGWASVIAIKGQPFEDSQGDIIDAPTLEKATGDFMMDVRRAMSMHERNPEGGIDEGMAKGVVVHSMPLTPEIKKAFGLQSDMDGWIVGVKVLDDDVWKKVKSGELAAFSIGGRGYRVPA